MWINLIFRNFTTRLVPAVVDRAGKLVADVDAETAAGMQHPLAFIPDKVQVVDVAFVTLMKADLVLRPVVLELPVRWRGNNKMHRPVGKEVHLSAVAMDYGVVALQGAVGCMGFGSWYSIGPYLQHEPIGGPIFNFF